MAENKTDTTPIEDVSSELSEQEMLESLADDFFQEKGETLPETEEDTVEADEEEDDADDAETDETTEDEEELETEESEEEDDQEAVAEGLPDTEEPAELDMEYEIPVKVDGEQSTIPLKELIKGYQTSQHANKKSIEASERLKEAEQAFTRVNELQAENAELLKHKVDKDQQQLDAYDAKIKKLLLDDNVFELPKWQEARRIKAEQLEKNRADQTSKEKEARDSLYKQNANAFAMQKDQSIATLNETIPGWEDTYDSVVDWAVKDLGFPEFAEILDPRVVSLMYDYKALKEGSQTAAKKRLKAPVKSVKTKKSQSSKTKQARRDGNLRDKVLSGKGSENEQLNFLEGLAGKVLE